MLHPGFAERQALYAGATGASGCQGWQPPLPGMDATSFGPRRGAAQGGESTASVSDYSLLAGWFTSRNFFEACEQDTATAPCSEPSTGTNRRRTARGTPPQELQVKARRGAGHRKRPNRDGRHLTLDLPAGSPAGFFYGERFIERTRADRQCRSGLLHSWTGASGSRALRR